MHYYCSMGRGFRVKGILLFHQGGRFVNLSIMDHFAHVETREPGLLLWLERLGWLERQEKTTIFSLLTTKGWIFYLIFCL